MKKNQIYFLLVAFMCLSQLSCDKDDPEVPNEEELITTLTYTLSPNGGGDPVVFTFRDLDGDGGDDPIIQGGTLAANQSYVGRVEFLNEAEIPAEDITEEVEEESVDHQVFFSSSLSGLSVTYADTDDNGNRLGLVTNLTTSSAGNGILTITLRHEPDKSAAGVSSGDISNAGGSTDVEAMFTVNVQ